MNKIVPFAGYAILSLVYAYYLFNNINKKNNLVLLGNVLVLAGYGLLSYKYYLKIMTIKKVRKQRVKI